MKSYVRASLLACAIVVIGGSPATAQFVVIDAATTAQNRVTAVLKELLYRLQQQQHDKILEMARRLSALTDLTEVRDGRRPALENARGRRLPVCVARTSRASYSETPAARHTIDSGAGSGAIGPSRPAASASKASGHVAARRRRARRCRGDCGHPQYRSTAAEWPEERADGDRRP